MTEIDSDFDQTDPKILHFDKAAGWLALDKPANWSVHNNEAGPNCAEWLAEELQIPLKSVHTIHRLDAGTSGIMLMAVQKESARFLSELFQGRLMQKSYFAVTRRPRSLTATTDEWKTWMLPLSDRAEGRQNPAGNARDRKPSVTHYQVQTLTSHFAFLELKLETGRTHQIRRHAALANLHLIGDTRYGDQAHAHKINELYGFSRLALHAGQLEFKIGEERFCLKSNLPVEFNALLASDAPSTRP